MTSRTGSDRGLSPRLERLGGGFTVIELLVVIAVIGVLAAILLTVMGPARQSARKAQAQKEVNEIASAINTYFMEHSKYPPDTEDWGAWGYSENVAGSVVGKDIDLCSIHRYLASEVRSDASKQPTQQMSIKDERLINVDAKLIGEYADPWGNSFKLDSTHMFFNKTADPPRWEQKGWPYYRGASNPAEPTEAIKATFKVDFKVVSKGPDGKSTPYPFDPSSGSVADAEYARDDIRSW